MEEVAVRKKLKHVKIFLKKFKRLNAEKHIYYIYLY